MTQRQKPEDIQAFPLHWPVGYEKTADRKSSRFKTTLAVARDMVKDQIRLLKAEDLIISSNIPVKQNGELRGDWTRFKLEDPGVAIYFKHKNEAVSLCCDRYTGVHENLYAIGRTIEALRQIDRDGVSDFLSRTFTGFKALPEQSEVYTESIWEQLGLEEKPADINVVTKAYHNKAIKMHPDMPTGSHEAFVALKKVYEQAIQTYK